MAISKIWTLLALDRYARIMGINPMHFNGGNQVDLPDGRRLFPLDNDQNNIWPQFSWQNSDQLSREDLARQIWIAENDLALFTKFYPSATWVEDEVHRMDEYYRPEYGVLSTDLREDEIAIIEPRFRKIISGGKRAVTTLASHVAISYLDNDLDGYSEVARVTVNIGVSSYDLRDIHIYHDTYCGNRDYEIRVAKSRSISGTTITFDFDSWHFILPSALEFLPTDESGSIDTSLSANLQTHVDVGYEYNDATQSAVTFVYMNPNTGAVSTQGGFLIIRNENEVIPIAANYNSTTGQWDRVSCYYNYVKINYFSGEREYLNNFYLSNRNDYLKEFYAVAIAYLATARLEKVFYANNNATSLATNLMRDLQFDSEGTSQFTSDDISLCPFGTRFGEVYTYKRLMGFRLHGTSGVAV